MGYQYDTSQFASSGYPQVINFAGLPSALVYAEVAQLFTKVAKQVEEQETK